MANEWQSLLQGAPDLDKLNLLGNFNTGYSTAVEQKKTAYDMYRQQKAQEIVSKASRPGGGLDWDLMYKLGSDAGIGLDAFNQVHKMQQDRAAAESALKQQQGLLRSMGEDRTLWDPSAKPIDVFMREEAARRNFGTVDTTPTPYVAPTAAESARYDNLGVIADELAAKEAQARQEPTTPSVPSSVATPAPVAPVAPSSSPDSMDLGQKNIVVGQLPAPAMRDPNADDLLNAEGYYNRLWRDTSDYGTFGATGAGGASGAGVGVTGSFSVESMGDIAKDRLATYLAGRGVDTKDLQTAVDSLESMAINTVPKPVMVMPEGTTVEAIAKARNLNMKAQAEYAAKVADAKLKFSDDMQKGNYEVLTKQLAQTASGLAKRQDARQQRAQEHELASLTPDTNPLIHREVTRAELGKIQDMQAGYADYRDAMAAYTRNPSLGSIGALAVAKLKANGQPITMDGIESYILSSGAVPKEQELIMKRALRDMDVAVLLGATAVKLSGLGITEQPIDDTKLKNEKENIEWDIYRRGGLPYEGYMSPTGKAPSGSGESESAYSEIKMNNAGVKVGRRKSDGKWEPVR